ncbi:hypothetical protein M2138_000630 [Dysgonomonadaceae bacterium PH5-43]|nr:hypothetical protein [Dysgonomonadaceae bacterium PH5-43]
MKKFIVSFVLLLSTIAIFPQSDNAFKPELSYGINGGITLSKVRFVFSVPQDNFIQPQGGITVRYISEKNFGLQAELNYSLRGWKERTDSLHVNKYTRSVGYLELPLMTHIYFNISKRFRGVFNIGPQIGYYLGEATKEKVLYPPNSSVQFLENGNVIVSSKNNNVEENDAPSYYYQDIQRKFDYGIVGGGGLELQTGIGNFILEGRYYFGLSDIFNNKRSDYFQTSSNQVISIKLSYLTRF